MMTGRYELKYLITPSQRKLFLADAMHALSPDPHGVNAAYRVTSLYYDTADYCAYWEKMDGEEVRRKFRMRYYGETWDGSDGGPMFLEVKHRINNMIFKQRVLLSLEAVHAILQDSANLGSFDQYVRSPTSSDVATIATIQHAFSEGALLPVAVITYAREAWQAATDNRLRLTFDSDCRELPPASFLDPERSGGVPFIDPGQIIMEIKFDVAIPRWIRELIVKHQLAQQRFSKYASGIQTSVEEYVSELAVKAKKVSR